MICGGAALPDNQALCDVGITTAIQCLIKVFKHQKAQAPCDPALEMAVIDNLWILDLEYVVFAPKNKI